jgi:hypothetical protein
MKNVFTPALVTARKPWIRGPARLALQEVEELHADLGPRAVEVQVRDEERRHERGGPGPITSLRRS